MGTASVRISKSIQLPNHSGRALTTYFEPKEEMRPNCWKRTLYSRNSQGELVGLLFALTLDISQGECAVHGFPAGRMVDGFIERCTQKSDTEEGGIP